MPYGSDPPAATGGYGKDPVAGVKPAGPSFPYDAPGKTYGEILPFAKDDKTGSLEFAMPEAVRAPVRGAVEFGKGLMGKRDIREPQTPEMASAVMGLGGVRGSPATRGTAIMPKINPISPERALLAKEAIDKFGIPITGPMIGVNPTMKYAESTIRHIPFSGAGSEERVAKEAFNRAVSKTIGADSPVITQQTMNEAKRRIGGTLSQIEAAAKVKLGDEFVDRVSQIEAEARLSMSDEEFGVLERNLKNVVQHLQPDDTLKGETYANLLHQGSPLDRAVSHDNSNIAYYAGQVKEALQDALESSLDPKVADAYRAARFQYKNMKTIEPLVNKSPDGDISPALLSARVTQQFENRAYDASRDNALDRLGKIGQAFLKEPGTSGSSERGAVKAGLAKLGELGAAIAAGNFLGVPLAAAGAGTALGAGRLTGNYLRSPGLAQRTINRALQPRGPVTQAPRATIPLPLGGNVTDAVNPPLPYEAYEAGKIT